MNENNVVVTSNIEQVTDIVKNAYLDKVGETPTRHKVYAVMLFETELSLGKSSNPNKWECTNIRYFENGGQALDYYANTPCPASQIIDSFDKEDLEKQIAEMKVNYQNPAWLEENLYPYM